MDLCINTVVLIQRSMIQHATEATLQISVNINRHCVAEVQPGIHQRATTSIWNVAVGSD